MEDAPASRKAAKAPGGDDVPLAPLDHPRRPRAGFV